MLGEKFLLMVIKKILKIVYSEQTVLLIDCRFQQSTSPGRRTVTGIPSLAPAWSVTSSCPGPTRSVPPSRHSSPTSGSSSIMTSSPLLPWQVGYIVYHPSVALFTLKIVHRFLCILQSFLKCKIVIAINVNCKHTVYTHFSQRVTRLIPYSTVALRTCKYLS